MLLTRWAETRDYGRRLTNAEPRPCESCGLELAPGRARVWRCSGLDCAVEEHRLTARRGNPARGLHVTCLDAEACRERRRPPAPGVHELAASAREAWRELMVREARERVRARLAEQRERPAATMRPPRYDEVWERGAAWLESLAHEPQEERMGEGLVVVVDTETTGLDPDAHEVIDVHALLTTADLGTTIAEAGGRTPLIWRELAEPGALEVNHYSPERWAQARPLADVLPGVLELVARAGAWLGSNPGFDVAFIERVAANLGLEMPPVPRLIDTAAEARLLGVRGPGPRPHSLDALCELYHVPQDGAHTARADCVRALEVYRRLTTAERQVA